MFKEIITVDGFKRLKITTQSDEQIPELHSVIPVGPLPSNVRLVAERPDERTLIFGLSKVEGAPDQPSESADDLASLTNEQLRDRCAELGIEFKAADTKPILIQRIRDGKTSEKKAES